MQQNLGCERSGNIMREESPDMNIVFDEKEQQ
jgi:hypothetical protein